MINKQFEYKKVISSICLKKSVEVLRADDCYDSIDCCPMDAPEVIPTGGSDSVESRNFSYRSNF